jgi:hypothetical protein
MFLNRIHPEKAYGRWKAILLSWEMLLMNKISKPDPCLFEAVYETGFSGPIVTIKDMPIIEFSP